MASKALKKKGRGRPATDLPKKTERIFYRVTKAEYTKLWKRHGADINGGCRRDTLAAVGIEQ